MKRAEKSWRSTSKGMQDSAKQIGLAIGAASVAGVTALAALTKQAINTGDQFAKMSQKVGVGVESLSRLGYAAGQSGVELAQLQSGLVKLAKNASDAAQGTGTAVQGFQALGIAVKNADGSLKNTDVLLKEIATKFAGYEDGANKTALAVNLFGRAGAELIPLLNEGADGIQELEDRARALGLEISTNTAQQSELFNDLLEDMGNLTKGLGNDIASQLLPSLNSLSERAVESGIAMRKGGGGAEALANAIKVVIAVAYTGKAAVEAITNVVAAQVDVMIGAGKAAKDLIENYGNIGSTAARAATGTLKPLSEINKEFTQTLLAAEQAAGSGIQDAVDGLSNAYSALFAVQAPAAEAVGETSEAAKNAAPALLNLAQQTSISAKAAADLARAASELDQAMSAQRAAISPMHEVMENYNRGMAEAAALAAEWEKAGVAEAQVAEYLTGEIAKLNAARDAEIKTIKARNAAMAKQQAAPQRLLAAMQDELKLLGMTTEQRNRAVAAMRAQDAMLGAIAEAQNAGAQFNQQQIDDLLGFADANSQAIESATELQSILSSFEDMGMSKLVRDLELVESALKRGTDAAGEAFSTEQIELMRRAAAAMKADMAIGLVGALKSVSDGLGSMAEEGSSAQRNMQKVSAALAVTQAVLAVITAAQAPPPVGFATMAAMAAAVGGLLSSIGAAMPAFGGGGGPSADSAEVRQAQQGAGTVFGDVAAKSESIAKAIDITANATTQLVGINRGMLRALQTLESGIGSATGMIARGGWTPEVGSLSSGGGILSGLPDPLGLSNMIFGGKEKLIDQGIVIMGGALSAILQNITVGAYNTIHRDGGLFRSDRTRTNVTDITGEFGEQFQAIIESIANTVREGALALGLLPDQIEAAIAAFRIEEVRISMMGLSAEEQQAELAAVFSSIFDGLAGDVVTFIEQFQQLGEGLGETLVRVATGVQVTQEAIIQLGFSLGQLGPEQFAQVSEGLIGLAGGIDEFISGMTTFVEAFAPESHRFAVAQDSITRAFEQFGLTVPATRDGMWALMQSLDATTESGREQIATLLRLAGVADSYYSMLEEQAEALADAIQFSVEGAMKYVDVVRGIQDQISALDGTSELQISLRDVAEGLTANIASLNEAARAAGLQAAREEDLAQAHQLAALQAARAAAQLEAAGRALAEQLYGSPLGNLDAEIARLEEIAGSSSVAVSSFGDAMTEAADAASDAVRLLLGDLSPLRDRQKLPLALQALQRGEIGAEDVLRIGQRLMSSGADYNRLFAQVQSIVAMRGGVGSGPAGPGGENYAVQAQLEILREQRDAMQAQQEAAQRFSQASELAQIVADLSGFRGEDFAAVLESLTGGQATFEQFAADLGLDSIDALEQYLSALQADSYTIEDIAATITAGDQLIVDTLERLFEERRIKPDDDGFIARPKFDAEIANVRAEETAVLTDRIDALLSQVETLTSISAQTAANTGNTAASTGQLVGDRAAARSELAGQGERSIRRSSLPDSLRRLPV